jgi:hypothetical protein
VHIPALQAPDSARRHPLHARTHPRLPGQYSRGSAQDRYRLAPQARVRRPRRPGRLAPVRLRPNRGAGKQAEAGLPATTGACLRSGRSPRPRARRSTAAMTAKARDCSAQAGAARPAPIRRQALLAAGGPVRTARCRPPDAAPLAAAASRALPRGAPAEPAVHGAPPPGRADVPGQQQLPAAPPDAPVAQRPAPRARRRAARRAEAVRLAAPLHPARLAHPLRLPAEPAPPPAPAAPARLHPASRRLRLGVATPAAGAVPGWPPSPASVGPDPARAGRYRSDCPTVPAPGANRHPAGRKSPRQAGAARTPRSLLITQNAQKSPVNDAESHTEVSRLSTMHTM